MEKRGGTPAALLLALAACVAAPAPDLVPAPPSAEPGVRMLPIVTPRGQFRVYTRTVGDNPEARVLLLHGGPGATHDYLKVFERHLPPAGLEIVFYDQLGSYHSDRPDAPELWEIDRFVDEVEQVRRQLGLGRDDFYLLGHSWGGILAIEYALAHPDRLAGLIVSNMMASIPAYNEYAREVLMPQMDPAVLADIQDLEAAGDTADPRYMELLMEHHYVHHVLRRPADQWPEDAVVGFERINPDIYVPMQGPSELGASGKLERWDRTGDLRRIEVPTLVIGAAHDTMDPAHMEWMAGELPNGRYLGLPDGSHLAMYDDEERYFAGVIAFVRDVEAGRFPEAGGRCAGVESRRETEMRQNIQAIVYPDSGGYVAECPDLHAVTQGDTLDETIANLREVVALAVEDEDLATRGLVSNPTILVTVEIEPLRRAG